MHSKFNIIHLEHKNNFVPITDQCRSLRVLCTCRRLLARHLTGFILRIGISLFRLFEIGKDRWKDGFLLAGNADSSLVQNGQVKQSDVPELLFQFGHGTEFLQ